MAGEERLGFSTDPARFLTGSEPGQSRLRLAPNDVLWSQGDVDDGLYYVESGQLKVAVVSPNGREAIITLHGEGAFFGMRSLVKPRRGATVTALTACSLLRISAAATLRMVREEPDFAEMLVRNLVLRAMRIDDAVLAQLTKTSEQRLARILLELANLRGNSDRGMIVAPVNQAMLAEMIGTTRSRVSYFMNKFRRAGFIQYNRQGYVTVHKSLKSVDAERSE
jgi:CRP/FNR family transcriptional regulator, cyclic AMP receptor protein